MYSWALVLHSAFRWIALIVLLAAIIKSFAGWVGNKQYTPADNALRHWTATIFHIQLILGMLLYTESPIVKYFWKNTKEALEYSEMLFFGATHAILMLTAITIVTIGSAKAKRATTDIEKFKTVTIWFMVTLVLIFVAIPWQFSPFANRPYIRLF